MPRVFSWEQESEIETGMAKTVRDKLAAMGHPVDDSPHVGGGMCAIGFDAEGGMTGAACRRADGVPISAGGGLACAGISFWPESQEAGKVDGEAFIALYPAAKILRIARN